MRGKKTEECPWCSRKRSQQGVPFTVESLNRHIRMAHRKEIKELNRELGNIVEDSKGVEIPSIPSISSIPLSSREQQDSVQRAFGRRFLQEDRTEEAGDKASLEQAVREVRRVDNYFKINFMVMMLLEMKLTYGESEVIVGAAKLAMWRRDVEEKELGEGVGGEDEGNFSSTFPKIA